MQQKVFNPKFVPVVWALAVFYAAPWLFAVLNLFLLDGTADWKLFWLLSGTAWAAAGLTHLKDVLLRRITFSDFIVVEMAFMRPSAQRADAPVRIRGDVVQFYARPVFTQYLANAGDLMQLLTQGASSGELQVVCEDAWKQTVWAEQRNLLSLIAFSLYMIAAIALKFRPFELVGPITDPMLLGLGAVVAAAIAVKAIQGIRKKPE